MTDAIISGAVVVGRVSGKRALPATQSAGLLALVVAGLIGL